MESREWQGEAEYVCLKGDSHNGHSTCARKSGHRRLNSSSGCASSQLWPWTRHLTFLGFCFLFSKARRGFMPSSSPIQISSWPWLKVGTARLLWGGEEALASFLATTLVLNIFVLLQSPKEVKTLKKTLKQAFAFPFRLLSLKKKKICFSD